MLEELKKEIAVLKHPTQFNLHDYHKALKCVSDFVAQTIESAGKWPGRNKDNPQGIGGKNWNAAIDACLVVHVAEIAEKDKKISNLEKRLMRIENRWNPDDYQDIPEM